MAKLVVINGRLRIDETGSSTLVKVADDANCCCNNCTRTQSGVIDTTAYGWSVVEPPTTLPIEIAFRYENSLNCGGSNPNTQFGEISCYFRLDDAATIEMSVSGPVEQQAFGFDKANLQITDNISTFNVNIGSVGSGLGCTMIAQQQLQTIELGPGDYYYKMIANTVDAAFHTNMTHTFKIRQTA